MRDRQKELGDAEIAVVTFASPDELADHQRHLNVPFPVLADPERATYRRFGLGRGSLREIWSLSTLRMYKQLLTGGRKLRVPRHDTRQLGGDFVVGPDGQLAAAFYPRSPDERPSVDELVAAVNTARE